MRNHGMRLHGYSMTGSGSGKTWTRIMQNMIADGANNITEVGPGKVLQGLFKKVDRKIQTQSAAI